MAESMVIRIMLALVLTFSSSAWCCCAIAGRQCGFAGSTADVEAGSARAVAPEEGGGCCGSTAPDENERDPDDDQRPGCRCGGHLVVFTGSRIIALPGPAADVSHHLQILVNLPVSIDLRPGEPEAGGLRLEAAVAGGIPRAGSLHAQRVLLTV